MRTVFAICCLLGLLLARLVGAYPTLTGPTGTVALPTVDTAGPGVVLVAADYYATESGTFPARLVAGIGCPLEVGIAYTMGKQVIDDRTRVIGDPVIVDEVLQDDLLGANAKLQLPWRVFGGLLALGGQYYSGDLRINALDEHLVRTADTVGDISATQVYLVLTRPFSACDEIAVIRGSLGVNWTEVEQEIDAEFLPVYAAFDDTHDAVRLFVSVDVNVIDLVAVAAEYQTKAGDLETDALYGIVVRYAFAPNLTGQLGFTNAAGVLGTSHTNLFLGATYAFGRTS